MIKLANFEIECDQIEARSILYYTIRYLKQANHFNEYKKDIFEDARELQLVRWLGKQRWISIAAIEEARRS